MSRRKIESLAARHLRQQLTRGMTKKERQAWGNAGRPMTKNGFPIIPGQKKRKKKKKEPKDENRDE